MDKGVIQAIKEKLDIADIVRRYVELKPVSGRWMGACPFHQETKPSMSVNSDEGFFYCFGCQASGDVFDFYSRINGLDFPETLEQLAAEAGVDLKPGKVDPDAAKRSSERRIFTEMHDVSASYFTRMLGMQEGRTAREYLKRRGVNPDIIEKFRIGYSTDDWQGLQNFLVSKGYSVEHAVKAGLLSKNNSGRTYDRFRGRLIFPIQNLSGKIIAFGGRIIIEGEPKYLNSSDTPIYKKGDNLYGLSQARTKIAQTKRALLTEGYMDVLSLHQFGYTNACGVLGTALTSDQVKRLSGFCSRVDLVFDGDSAGMKAALRSAEMILAQGVACGVVVLPDGEDVDSLLQTYGAEGFQKFLDEARDGLDFCLSTLKAGHAPKEIMAWAEKFVDHLSTDALKAFYLPKLASGLGIAEIGLRSVLAESGSSTPGRMETKSKPVVKKVPVGSHENDDKYFLRFAVRHPEFVQELFERGVSQVLSSHWGKKLWSKIAAHSGEDILPYLEDSEKSFWTGCRMQPSLDGDELSNEWRHLCRVIAKKRFSVGRKQLMDALRQAQAQGDRERVEAYLKALNDSVWRDDEQH